MWSIPLRARAIPRVEIDSDAPGRQVPKHQPASASDIKHSTGQCKLTKEPLYAPLPETVHERFEPDEMIRRVCPVIVLLFFVKRAHNLTIETLTFGQCSITLESWIHRNARAPEKGKLEERLAEELH